jgi:hypothetical protein
MSESDIEIGENVAIDIDTSGLEILFLLLLALTVVMVIKSWPGIMRYVRIMRM